MTCERAERKVIADMRSYSGYAEKVGEGGGIFLVKRGHACRVVDVGGDGAPRLLFKQNHEKRSQPPPHMPHQHQPFRPTPFSGCLMVQIGPEGTGNPRIRLYRKGTYRHYRYQVDLIENSNFLIVRRTQVGAAASSRAG